MLDRKEKSFGQKNILKNYQIKTAYSSTENWICIRFKYIDWLYASTSEENYIVGLKKQACFLTTNRGPIAVKEKFS